MTDSTLTKEGDIDLVLVGKLIATRKWVVFVVTIIGALAGYGSAEVIVPTYKATVVGMPEGDRLSFVGLNYDIPFGDLGGVGERKLELYADAFLEIIRSHPRSADGPST